MEACAAPLQRCSAHLTCGYRHGCLLRRSLRRCTRFLLLLSGCLLLGLPEATGQWEQKDGPYGGIITAFASIGSNLFAGTDGRGVFLSTDGGNRWTPVNSGLSNPAVLTLIAYGTNLLAGTRGGGVFISTDTGSSWKPVNTGITDFEIYSLVAYGATIFAGATHGTVFLSTNNGASWTPVNTGATTRVLALFVSGVNVFAGTNGNGAYRSTDGGLNWTAANIGLAGNNVFCFAANGASLFAGLYESGVCFSSDNGSSWTDVGSQLPDKKVKCIAYSGGFLFAGTQVGGIFRSSNNGTDWTAMNAGVEPLDIQSMYASGASIYAGTYGGGVLVSTTYGLSWAQINTGLSANTVFSIVSSGTNLVAGTYGGGAFISTNSGESWTASNAGLTDRLLYSFCVDGANLFAGSIFSGVYLSTDNGLNWTHRTGGPVNQTVHAIVVNDTKLFAGTYAGGVYLSTDNGVSWTGAGLADQHIFSLAASGQYLIAGTEANGVFISTNNGTTWSSANLGLTNPFVHALVVSGQALYAGTIGGGVYKSTDFGTSWTQANSGLTKPYILSLALDGTNLFAGTDTGGVFVSTDNGSTWRDVNNGLGALRVRSLLASRGFLYAGCDGGGVWRRPLAGLTTGPAAPVATRATSLAAHGFDANWQVSPGATGYRLDVASDSGFAFISSSYNNRDVGNVASFPVSGMLANSQYYYRVRAVSEGGASPNSNAIAARTTENDWILQPGGTSAELHGVAFWNANIGIALGGSATIIRTTDGGINWAVLTSPTAADLWWIAVPPQSGTSVGTIVGNTGTILRTTDAGANWTPQTSGTVNHFRGVHFTDINTGVAVGENGTILRTTNGGVSWTSQSSSTSSFLRSVFFTDENTGIVVGYGGVILRTTNGGSTWSARMSGTGEDLMGVAFADASVGCAVGNHGTILWTMNGGENWSSRPSNTADCLWGTTFVPRTGPGVEMTVGDFGTLLNTTDGGASWSDHASTTDNHLRGVAFTPANVGIIVGKNGTILRRAAGSIVAPQAPTAAQPTDLLNSGFTAHWTNVLGADSYRLDVAKDSAFSTPGSVYNNLDVGLVTSRVITGLSPSTLYYYRVRSANAGGQSPNSNCVEVTTLAAEVGVPTATAATNRMATGFTAHWTSVTGAIRYYLDVAADAEFTSFVSGYTNLDVQLDTAHVVSGLLPMSVYYYRVRAASAEGTSKNSNVIAAVTLPFPPSPPKNVGASAFTVSSFVAAWTEVMGATGYRLDVATDSNFAGKLAGYDDFDVGTATTHTVGSLRPNMTYYFVVRAVNEGGTSGNSDTASVQTLPNSAGVPTATAQTNVTQTTFTANWTRVDGATAYRLDVANDTAFSFISSNYNNLDVGDTTSHDVVGLSPSSSYYYRVRSVSAGGTSGNSNVIAVTTLPYPPAAPTAFPASDSSNSGFRANWSSVLGATSYRLDVATDSAFSNTVPGFNNLNVALLTAYDVTGLAPETRYYYRIRAVNAAGASANSNTIQVHTLQGPPGVPTSTAATNITSSGFTAHWSGVVGAVKYHLDVARDAAFLDMVASYADRDVGNVTHYDVEGLAPSTAYYYRTRAISGGGPSISSNVIMVTTRIANTPLLFGEYQRDASTMLLLHLDEDAGATVLDASSNCADGWLSGAYRDAGRFGRGVKLPTTTADSGIVVPRIQALDVDGPMTLECWFKTNAFDAEGGTLISNRNRYALVLGSFSGSGKLQFSFPSGGFISTYQCSRQIPLGRWTHLAAVWDGGVPALYIDGVPYPGEVVGRTSPAVEQDALLLGSYLNQYSAPTSAAVIDEIRISNRARLPQEFGLQLPPTNISSTTGYTTINLTWENGGGMVSLARYRIYRGTDSTSLKVVDSTLSTAYVNVGLTMGTTYYCRVTAVDSTGFESAPSKIVPVTTRVLNAPVPAEPISGSAALPTSVVLRWRAVSEASQYHIEVSCSPDFTWFVLNDSTLTDTTRSVSSLARNATYFWRVAAIGAGGKSSFSSPAFMFKTIDTVVYASALIYDFASWNSSTDYRLFSVPGVTSYSVAQILSGNQKTGWRVFEDNGGVPPNHLTELDANGAIAPGKGYWILRQNQFQFSQTVAMPVLDTSGTSAIPLRGGWNLIGSPLDRAVAWAAVQASNGSFSEQLWAYNGPAGFGGSVQLEPFRGYYFYNALGLQNLKIPYPFVGRTVQHAPAFTFAWRLRVALESDGLQDSENTIGLALPNAEGTVWRNQRKPPPFQQQTSLYFTGSDDGGESGNFSTDYRTRIEEGAVWEFEILNPRRAPSCIHVDGVESVPAGFKVCLVNRIQSRVHDLRLSPRYEYQSIADKMSFMLMVGKEGYIEAQMADLLPTEFCLEQNYPNPFNPSTSLRFSVPRVAHVRVDVFSSLGQRITSLANGLCEPGVFSLTWDGTNEQGRNVASGAYFCCMLVDGRRVDTKAMLLVK